MLLSLAVASTTLLSSCNDDKDEFSTDQYTGEFRLNVWGPTPVARGGELRFLGVGMDKITAVTLPGSGKITDLKRISSEEMRLTVPQDAEEGYITVHTPDGDIVSKTLLSFLEPISIESISPAKVKPGEKLTITGEYLNKIHEIIFSEDKNNPDVTVPEEDFISHSRSEISLIVPALAKSGGIILSDADPDMPNWIISEKDIEIVLPQVDKIISMDKANPGDVITVKGSDLDLVVAVVMANGENIEFKLNSDGSITFTLPDNACQGPICFVTQSGIEVVAVNIGDCRPENLVATPAAQLRGGSNVVITGKNLQMVATVSLPTAGDPVEAAFKLESNEKISFEFPASAQSGNAVLALKGGGEVYVALSTLKPQVTTTDALPAGKSATISGKDIDLIASITFADGSNAAVTNIDASQARVTVPVTATSGVATLNMANGETAEWTATISAPTGAYIISANTEVGPNRMVTFTIGNPEKLIGVIVNSVSVKYIVDGSTLIVFLPENYGRGTRVVLNSNDGSSLVYTFDFVNPDSGPLAIWEGSWTNSGWSGNQDLAWGGFDWSTIAPGTTLTAHCTPLNPGEWWCVSFRHGNNWGNLPGDVGAQIDEPEDGMASIFLSQEVLDDLINEGGLVITGDGYTLTKVTIE